MMLTTKFFFCLILNFEYEQEMRFRKAIYFDPVSVNTFTQNLAQVRTLATQNY